MNNVSDQAPRVIRHINEHKKVGEMARQVAAMCPAIERCEPDPRVPELASKAAFEKHDLIGVRIWTPTSSFTLILVPLRLWYKALWFTRAIEFRNYMRRLGVRCIIAPASCVQQQPRLRNAQMVAACSGLAVRMTDQMNILGQIIERGNITLEEAAGLMQSSDPAGSVLAMVAKRLVSIDCDKPIGPHSLLTQVG